MAIFYAATTITVGNVAKTPFWCAPWLHGRAPIDIAPLIFESSKRKKYTMAQAISGSSWVRNISLANPLSPAHISQFVELWALVRNVQLREEKEYNITWNLMDNGQYSASSAYAAQFFGLVYSDMCTFVWKAWATPKTKHHAWLALLDRLWTADRLQRRGWPNCGLCPFCKQVPESTNHLFVNYRFSIRIWEILKEWICIHEIYPREWGVLNINEWWKLLAAGPTPQRKALATLMLLTVWELWNERNARVFRNKSSPSFVVLDRIKNEARLWVLAGAKKLGSIMPGE
jgi:hypothetical protein